jgi:hypothetical protein
VGLGGQEHLDVLARRVENRGEVAGGHLEGLSAEVAAEAGCGWEVRDVESSVVRGQYFVRLACCGGSSLFLA